MPPEPPVQPSAGQPFDPALPREIRQQYQFVSNLLREELTAAEDPDWRQQVLDHLELASFSAGYLLAAADRDTVQVATAAHNLAALALTPLRRP
ncbi:hypothetical protein Kpho01_68930 [Kitasatospora phosalacinea]|uniref:Uncharacterized protein n=1 Tax=Kitasatospora phosalacinea TaxID=2065 RepID=A0A9W6PQ10_9ACTN|nr:hypothetical protein Kpho01_68930 [Kitasatospora phosalacinea]